MSQDNSGAPEWPQFSSEVMRQGPAIRKPDLAQLPEGTRNSTTEEDGAGRLHH
jgi:hypothetical protein